MRLRHGKQKKQGFYASLAKAQADTDNEEQQLHDEDPTSPSKKTQQARPVKRGRGRRSKVHAVCDLAEELPEDGLLQALMKLVHLYLCRNDDALLKFVPVDFMEYLLKAVAILHDSNQENVLYYLAKLLCDTNCNPESIEMLTFGDVIKEGKRDSCEVVVPLQEALLDTSLWSELVDVKRNDGNNHEDGTAVLGDPACIKVEDYNVGEGIKEEGYNEEQEQTESYVVHNVKQETIEDETIDDFQDNDYVPSDDSKKKKVPTATLR